MRRSAVVLAACLFACARTGLLDFEGGEAGAGGGTASGGSAPTGGTTPSGGAMVLPHECTTVADCPVVDLCAPPTCAFDTSAGIRRCIPVPFECDDGNVCTVDSCDPATGVCRFEAPGDLDGDGFLGEPPPDAPASCGGNDCDDTNAMVFPGAPELCDGLDNDCNDGIDDGIDRTNVLVAPVPIVPPERDRAAHGGLVWNGDAYGVSYNTTTGHKQSYFKLIDELGADASAEVRVSEINADAFAGLIEWSGTSFLTAFSDARQAGNYEVYTARFDANGVKLEDDRRVTDAPGFSLNPVVVRTGEEYVVAWDDHRARMNGGVAQIFARRFTLRGEPVGGEVLVSPPDEWAEYPLLAVGERTLGLTYTTVGAGDVSRARFRFLALELESLSAAVDLPTSEDASVVSIAFSGEHFVVAWQRTFASTVPGNEIRVAFVHEDSGSVWAGRPVGQGLSFARSPSLVSLGADQSFLVFSGALADGAYELHSAILNPAVSSLVQVIRLTTTQPRSLFPYAARGPDGSIGIVFDEENPTPPASRRPHFMAVGCLPVAP